MTGKKLVRLFDHIGTGIIVEWKTNIYYSIQTAGNFCLWPEAEGFFFPVGNDADEENRFVSKQTELWNYFKEPNIEIEGAIRGISNDNADFIEKVLHKPPSIDYIKVDRERLSESHEGWVYVRIFPESKDEEFKIFAGFEGYPLKGILIWGC